MPTPLDYFRDSGSTSARDFIAYLRRKVGVSTPLTTNVSFLAFV